MALYEYKALCTRVIDGDSIVCDIDLGFSMVMHGQQIRLAGIDTP
jgi:micrococcal nuclease